MNRIKNSLSLARTSIATHTKTLNAFIDKYRVIKRMYYVGIAVNCYLSYRCLIKIIALSEVEDHI